MQVCMYFVPLCCCSDGPFEWNPSSCSPARRGFCPDAAPLCRYVMVQVLCSMRGAASDAQCGLGCVAGWNVGAAGGAICQLVKSYCPPGPATQCIVGSNWALPWRPVLAVALLCPSVAPCGPRCGPRWIAGRQPHWPAAADVPWRRPLAGGTSSPLLRTPARDASKSCPPADHPQTLNAAPTSRALLSALLPPIHSEPLSASKQPAGSAVQCRPEQPQLF